MEIFWQGTTDTEIISCYKTIPKEAELHQPFFEKLLLDWVESDETI